LTENSHRVKLYIQHGTGTNLSAEEKLNVLRGGSHQRFEDRIENVQEVKNTEPFHTFHETKSLYVKLEEGEFPSVWINIHTYRRFKATRRGLRASMSPGSTLSPHNLSERLANALRAYFFGGFLSFPTCDKNKYSTPRPVVKEKKLDACLYKITRSDTGFKDFRIEVLSLNGKNLQWEFRHGQEDKRGNRSREVSPYQGKDRQEFSLYL
jgi:hypothetical protein